MRRATEEALTRRGAKSQSHKCQSSIQSAFRIGAYFPEILDGRRAIKEALAKTGADTHSVRASIDEMEGYLLALMPLPAEPSQVELSPFRWVYIIDI